MSDIDFDFFGGEAGRFREDDHRWLGQVGENFYGKSQGGLDTENEEKQGEAGDDRSMAEREGNELIEHRLIRSGAERWGKDCGGVGRSF